VIVFIVEKNPIVLQRSVVIAIDVCRVLKVMRDTLILSSVPHWSANPRSVTSVAKANL